LDPISGLKGEFFRPLTSVLIPGVLAASPYAAMAFKRFPEINSILSSPFWVGGIILFAGILFGMLMENLGSRLEIILWRFCAKNAERDEEWKTYLQLKTTDEIIGQRYLRTLLTRLKFELSVVPAMICFAFGANWFNSQYGNVDGCQMAVGTFVVVLIIIYEVYEAKCSIVLLAEIRKNILTAVNPSSVTEMPVSPVAKLENDLGGKQVELDDFLD
jgi:hypothetical protein